MSIVIQATTKMSDQKRANEIDTHVGRRVLMGRKLANMSQERLAESLGITFQQVQKYEKGANRISAGRLLQIARILNEPISFFYEGVPKATDDTSSDERDRKSYLIDSISTNEGLDLNRGFVAIEDPKVRRKIVELVGALADVPGRKSKESNRSR